METETEAASVSPADLKRLIRVIEDNDFALTVADGAVGSGLSLAQVRSAFLAFLSLGGGSYRAFGSSENQDSHLVYTFPHDLRRRAGKRFWSIRLWEILIGSLSILLLIARVLIVLGLVLSVLVVVVGLVALIAAAVCGQRGGGQGGGGRGGHRHVDNRFFRNILHTFHELCFYMYFFTPCRCSRPMYGGMGGWGCWRRGWYGGMYGLQPWRFPVSQQRRETVAPGGFVRLEGENERGEGGDVNAPQRDSCSLSCLTRPVLGFVFGASYPGPSEHVMWAAVAEAIRRWNGIFPGIAFPQLGVTALEAATRFKGKRLQSINGEEVWEFSALAAATEGVQAQPLPAEIVPPPDDEENENALYPNQGGVAVGVPVDLENHEAPMYSFLVNCPDSGGDSAEVVPPPELSERHVDPQELHQRASLVFQEPAWPFDDLKPKDRKFAIFLGLLVIGGGFLMILFPPPLEEDHPTASWWIARVVFTYGLIYMLVPLLRSAFLAIWNGRVRRRNEKRLTAARRFLSLLDVRSRGSREEEWRSLLFAVEVSEGNRSRVAFGAES